MKKFSSLFIAASIFATTAVAEVTVLVELFASKHCTGSDHAKDNLQSSMAEDEDMLVLTWPVNYWYYLGDEEAPIAATSAERQSAYVERFGLKGASTPQTVYNGAAHCAGNKLDRVESALDTARRVQDGVDVSYASEGFVSVSGPANHVADVLLVEYERGAEQTEMLHVVKSVQKVGEWTGGNLSVQTPECDTSCAMLVQEKGQGVIYGAIDLTGR